MQIGLGLWLGTRQVGGFDPAAVLFGAGEQGGWYDSSDLSTMFQDSAGTTPVTATGQTVGLLLDKSQGLALGPERVTNGTFDTATGWSLNGGWAIGGGQATLTASGVSAALQQTGFPASAAGRLYVLTYTIVSNTLNSGFIRVGGFSGGSFFGATPINLPASVGSQVAYIYVSAPSGAGNVFDFWVTSGATTGALVIDNISVKELAGNHLTQATAASRPIYGIEPFGGRRNLLVRTEEFDNAAWTKTAATVTANAIAAPNLTITADKLVETATLNNHRVFQGITTATNPYTCTVYFKKGERDWAYIRLDDSTSVSRHAWFNLASGAVGTVETGLTASITLLGDGWYRCQATITAALAGTSNILFGIAPSDNTTSYTGDGTSGIYIWGAQLETGSIATAYQRVTDQWNVTQAGVPSVSYVQYDGTDDWFISPTITPGVDAVSVFAGIRKISDASRGALVELTASAASNNGAFLLAAPNASSATIAFESKGTALTDAIAASGVAAPITAVVTGASKISTDDNIIRINGVQSDSDAGDQGTGNFTAAPLYVGRRGGSSLPFNGRIYALVVRFAESNAAQISSTETWIAGKTGVTL